MTLRASSNYFPYSSKRPRGGIKILGNIANVRRLCLLCLRLMMTGVRVDVRFTQPADIE
jgi:hypothetical protein